jgi:hypothetical protein
MDKMAGFRKTAVLAIVTISTVALLTQGKLVGIPAHRPSSPPAR